MIPNITAACDGAECSVEVQTSSNIPTEAIDEMLARGWVVNTSNNQCWCPDHRSEVIR